MRQRSAFRRKPNVFLQQIPIWMTGTAFSLALLMIVGLLGLILFKGLGVFWPSPLEEIRTRDGGHYLGLIHRTEPMPHSLENPKNDPMQRSLYRIGNRDLYGADFIWVENQNIASRAYPKEAVVVERLEWGPFYGYLAKIQTPQTSAGADGGLWKALAAQLPKAHARYRQMRSIEKQAIGDINYAIEEHRLALRRLELKQTADSPQRKRHELAIEMLNARYQRLASDLAQKRRADAGYRVILTDIDGKEKELPLSSIVRLYQPNRLSISGKLLVYMDRLREFIFDQPREANSEGGVAPAIFGTVMMTLLMSLAVVPLGVLAALYLHEYAKQGWLVSIVRIAVNNLAGVPSIVFGVFGLGFFCYFLGGTIDQLFFSERLPTPTFGGGGILWASLTLALLTVPVVIVATEEALATVSDGIRAASLACGATKFQTIWRVVLPAAIPGILTGTILAMARGAGEVAPLMITGVVKLAPDLPLDHFAPFFHLERKFMHLGFHIFDVGFQSPNVEASKSMVYMTTILLLAIVVCLNLTAMRIRGKLREAFRGTDA